MNELVIMYAACGRIIERTAIQKNRRDSSFAKITKYMWMVTINID